jgi:hypothetical protein
VKAFQEAVLHLLKIKLEPKLPKDKRAIQSKPKAEQRTKKG